MNRLDSFFQLSHRGSSIGRELRGAAATFLTMAYILAVNPSILSAAGVPVGPAVACTALAAGICCLLMGATSNFPIALASGMGLNALVAFSIVPQTGSWQTAMGLVVLDGLIVLVLVLAGLREAMLDAIPVELRRAMAAGIALFIALIGAVKGGLVEGTNLPDAPLRAGSLDSNTALMTCLGLIATSVLMVRRVPGAILIGIVVTGVGLAIVNPHEAPAQSEQQAEALFSIAFQANIKEALQWKFVPLLLSLLLVDFFDTLGTVTALADQSSLLDENRRVPGLRPILIVDSISASIGGILGVSSVTSYIESAAGISEGARTGLHSIFVGLMFLLCIVAAPLLAYVPVAATAPALILVGFLMCEPITRIDFKQFDVAIPAFLTVLLIPMTFSISHGIGFGIISFVAIRALTGRWRDVHPLMYASALVFAAAFRWGPS